MRENGEPDGYSHRKKMSVAEALSAEMIRRDGVEAVVSDLTYDLRGGPPDFMDQLIASTFGHMAYEAIVAGQSGLMAAIHHDCYVWRRFRTPSAVRATSRSPLCRTP